MKINQLVHFLKENLRKLINKKTPEKLTSSSGIFLQFHPNSIVAAIILLISKEIG